MVLFGDNPFPFLPDHPHTRVALNRTPSSHITQATDEALLTGNNRASPRRSAPSIGPLIATAIAVLAPPPNTFRKARLCGGLFWG